MQAEMQALTYLYNKMIQRHILHHPLTSRQNFFSLKFQLCCKSEYFYNISSLQPPYQQAKIVSVMKKRRHSLQTSPYLLLVQEFIIQLTYTLVTYGMYHFRGYFIQRLQHKFSFKHSWVWND